MNRNEKKALQHMQRAQDLIREEQMGFGFAGLKIRLPKPFQKRRSPEEIKESLKRKEARRKTAAEILAEQDAEKADKEAAKAAKKAAEDAREKAKRTEAANKIAAKEAKGIAKTAQELEQQQVYRAKVECIRDCERHTKYKDYLKP